MSENRHTVDDFPSPTRAALQASGELKTPLSPSTQAMMQRMARYGGLSDSVSVGYARRRFRGLMPLLSGYPQVASVTDRTIAGPQGAIPIRIVRPVDDVVSRPVIVWFPGGGFVLGDLETGEPTARQLAVRTGAVVVCVDYRKAPEHRLDDCYDDGLAAVRWVHANAASLHIDTGAFVVGGDSAGGNIAAVVAQELDPTDENDPTVALQVLAYPAVSVEHEPARLRDREGTLDDSALRWFEIHVAGSANPRSRRYYPLSTHDVAGLPPAVILTAGWDPLRDEAITYLDRLREAGVRAEHVHYGDEVHGFMTLDLVLDNARPAMDRVGALICEILAIPEELHSPETMPGGVEAQLSRLKRRVSLVLHEASEVVGYGYIRSQRRTLRWLGLPAGRDVDRTHSQLLRLELQVRALRRELDEQQARSS